ncbi:Uncharacterized protein FKW44_019680 [Caligus rogercresseyi]|uniref:Uncharacterized protein n=1 Tax=Caligus rogercresseyi TaxID=217165 RepID=A0A7T8GWX9_CALRO|nr:Uncharacterized protein FKW44_019680 [Caligus rogercresseyi]
MDALNARKYCKTYILFGLLSHKASARTNVINHSSTECQTLVSKSLTMDRPLQPLDIRTIRISASARYAPLDLRIPSVTDNSWTLAGNLVKYVPSHSIVLRDSLKEL